VVLALFLLWLMDRRLLAAREEFAATFEPPTGSWLLFVLLGVLAGVAFGLALTWPTRYGGYRLGRVAVVGALPLVTVVLGTVFVLDISGIPAFLLEFTFVYAGGFQSVAAVMLGAALGSGFAEPKV
jgi:hypothetical protein